MNKGNALALVLLTVMVVSLLAVSVLYVTGISRDVTARYANYTGVYDLAVAGNENAYLIYKNVLENTEDSGDEDSLAEPDDMDAEGVSLEVIADLYEDALLENGFEPTISGYRLKWNMEITTDIVEIFTAETLVARNNKNFTVKTVVRKTYNGQTGYPATVQLEIEWPSTVDYFDGSELPVLKSKRI